MFDVTPQNPLPSLLASICFLLLGSCVVVPTQLEADPEPFTESELAEWLEPGVTTTDDVLFHMRRIRERSAENGGHVARSTFNNRTTWLFLGLRNLSETVVIHLLAFLPGSGGAGSAVDISRDSEVYALIIDFDQAGIVKEFEVFKGKQRENLCMSSGLCGHFIRAGRAEEEAAKSMVIPPDRCAVYVYGLSGGGGWFDTHEVGLTLDGDYRGGYASNTFVRWLVPAGQHRLRADILRYRDFKRTRHTEDFPCPAGGAFFFKIGRKGGLVWHTGVKEIDPQTGVKEIQRLAMFVGWVDPYQPWYEQDDLHESCGSGPFSGKEQKRKCLFFAREQAVWPPPFPD